MPIGGPAKFLLSTKDVKKISYKRLSIPSSDLVNYVYAMDVRNLAKPLLSVLCFFVVVGSSQRYCVGVFSVTERVIRQWHFEVMSHMEGILACT